MCEVRRLCDLLPDLIQLLLDNVLPSSWRSPVMLWTPEERVARTQCSHFLVSCHPVDTRALGSHMRDTCTRGCHECYCQHCYLLGSLT